MATLTLGICSATFSVSAFVVAAGGTSRPRAGEDIEQGVSKSRWRKRFTGGSRMFQIQVPNDSGGRSTERIEVRIPPGSAPMVSGCVGGGQRPSRSRRRDRAATCISRYGYGRIRSSSADGDDLTTDVPVPGVAGGARWGR